VSDVFLSYANADRERAAALAEALGLRGYSVWWDRTIPPGRVFDEVIQEALSAAGCVVVLWSRTSASSNWVKTEAAEGASRHVLVPAVIDDVSIPIEFRRIQAANLQDWTGDPGHPEFEGLVQSVERLSRRAGQAAPPRLDHRAPGGLVRTARRISPRAAAAVAALAVVGGVALVLAARAYWPASPAPVTMSSLGAAPEEPPADPGAAPKVSFGNAPAPEASAPEAPAASAAVSVAGGRRVNLLARDNGGMVLAASNDEWTKVIDGREDAVMTIGEAVFAFRDERAALFDTFTVLVPAAGDFYLRDVELLAGNESPTGRFESLGTFHTRNMKLFKTPYQEFTFAAVRAKYLKVRAIANHLGTAYTAAHEFQLWGIPDAR
jgi:hypothetical protein